MFLNHILKNLIWIKCGYGSPAQRRKLKNRILGIMGKFVSIKCLKKLRYRLITSYNDKNTVFCFASDYPRTMLKNSWFGSFEYYSFENMKLKGYKEFDAYLTNAYGNYMELPPENERVCHSNYDIDFGIYDTETDN